MIILTDEQQVSVTVAFTTAAGNPATVDGVPTWQSSNEAVATVTPASDGLSALVVSTGLGVAQVSVQADADLGSGTRLISGLLDVDVRAAEAVAASLVAGTPELKPTTPPPTP